MKYFVSISTKNAEILINNVVAEISELPNMEDKSFTFKFFSSDVVDKNNFTKFYQFISQQYFENNLNNVVLIDLYFLSDELHKEIHIKDAHMSRMSFGEPNNELDITVKFQDCIVKDK